MQKIIKISTAVLATVFAVGFVVVMTGCSTIESRTLEYCENETQKFIGIPFSQASDCIGVAVDAAEGGIELPIRPDE